METKKWNQLSGAPKKNIKDHPFTNLPEGYSQWIVIAWGRVINDQKGFYQQEIILRDFSDNDSPSRIWNINYLSKLVYVKVNLGSLRVFTPGTIIHDKRILKFPHEYLNKIDIAIENPQAFRKASWLALNFTAVAGLKREHMTQSVDRIETRVLPNWKFGHLVIPCNVIADYYYYGHNKYLTAAILGGDLDSRFAVRNDVYNPNKLSRDISPTGKVVVRVELQRKMEFRDKYKIARLAHDDYFRDKCLDINANILEGTLAESYVDTDFPVQEPIVLSVYGIQLRIMGDSFFLVHSISKCTSKPPFDLVLAGKPFRGKNALPDLGGGDGEDKSELGLGPSDAPKKERTRKKLKEPESKIIDIEPPQWDAIPEDLPFENDQEDNFPDEAGVNELDLADPEKREEIIKTLLKFGVAPAMSTDPNKKGSGNILPINLTAQGPAKPKPAPPTEAFEIIENLSSFLRSYFQEKKYEIVSNIRCPIREGIDKYSAFPVLEIMKEETESDKKLQYVNYCFLYVQQKRHTHHRRIFINELIVNGRYFYIMDIEPKYKVLVGEEKKTEKFVSAFGVIFLSGTCGVSDENLAVILKKIVTTHRTLYGKWEFLGSFGFLFERIQHRTVQSTFESIIKFITTNIR